MRSMTTLNTTVSPGCDATPRGTRLPFASTATSRNKFTGSGIFDGAIPAAPNAAATLALNWSAPPVAPWADASVMGISRSCVPTGSRPRTIAGRRRFVTSRIPRRSMNELLKTRVWCGDRKWPGSSLASANRPAG